MECAWSLSRPRPEQGHNDPWKDWYFYRFKVNEIITLELLLGHNSMAGNNFYLSKIGGLIIP